MQDFSMGNKDSVPWQSLLKLNKTISHYLRLMLNEKIQMPPTQNGEQKQLMKQLLKS